MNKKLLFVIPSLLGLFLTACGGGGEPLVSSTSPTSSLSPSSVEPTSSATPSSEQQPSSVTPSSSIEEKYTVTFDSNGGSYVAPITVDKGDEVAKPDDPTQSGYKFNGWSSDIEGKNMVSWPYRVNNNVTLYAQWGNVIDFKAYLKTLVGAMNQNPYSYIPDTMKIENERNFVNPGDVNYNFNNFTNVNSIKYGGHGEQWHMVMDNIRQSEYFYKVFSVGEAAINASILLFNTYFDNNPGTTLDYQVSETGYNASVNYKDGVLYYSLEYKSDIALPLFGEVSPKIDMSYNVLTLDREVRVELNSNNAFKYVISENGYMFGIEYGLPSISRKAFFSIAHLANDAIAGHIYEFIQYKGEDIIPSCADFYIDETYATVVGNKAKGLIGFDGYINELYETDQGKLLGYEVRETLTILGVTGTYNTLWFNLNDISGIDTVRGIENGSATGTYTSKNPYDIYLNNSGNIFEPTYNTKLGVKTSRKYDVEFRKQYFYGYSNDELVEYETSIPMMFIQAGDNLASFSKDILAKSGITASVTLASKHLEKIQEDYATFIDVFIDNMNNVTGQDIVDFIG